MLDSLRTPVDAFFARDDWHLWLMGALFVVVGVACTVSRLQTRR